MVDPTGDEQQWGAVVVAEVDLGGRAGLEVCARPFEQHAARGRNAIALMKWCRGLNCQMVGEPVPELLDADRNRPAAIEWVAQDRPTRSQRRPRQLDDPFDGRRVDRHTGGAEAPIEQHLGERPTERVTHDDGWSRQATNQAFVVVDDLLDAQARDRRMGSRRRSSTLPCMPGHPSFSTVNPAAR